jgi:hypothetical protein
MSSMLEMKRTCLVLVRRAMMVFCCATSRSSGMPSRVVVRALRRASDAVRDRRCLFLSPRVSLSCCRMGLHGSERVRVPTVIVRVREWVSG